MYFVHRSGVLLVFSLGVAGVCWGFVGSWCRITRGGYTTAASRVREWLKFPKIIKRPLLR
nr:MAG TPA: hypothetical protein [Caudoviricetes sp.]